MHFNCVGVGCGPSNLSAASLLHRSAVTNIFFDSKPDFSWHEGMMLEDVTLQVSLFKDLVTLANPTNRFSFISYLHEHGRLYQFLNARFESLLRKEFAMYLRWAAKTNENVVFGEAVLDISFVDNRFVVATTQRQVTADHVVIGVGTVPKTPSFASTSRGQFHVSETAANLHTVAGKRVIVVGGGQSGAEAILALLRMSRGEAPASIKWVSRRENFYPIDDSPFTNEFYTPSHSEFFYQQPPDFRRSFLDRNMLSSDGISEQTLRSIYQRIYSLRHIEHSEMNIELLPYREAQNIERATGGWSLWTVRLHDGAPEVYWADVVIWATGFRPADMPFLETLAQRMERSGQEIKVDRYFCAQWDGPANRHVFLLNGARSQRGLADPNLSLNAWRAQTVINRMLNKAESLPIGTHSLIDWHKPGDVHQCYRDLQGAC
ncbi:SidA/IucD/PvdA family monooxygenase [Paraburkholderia sp. BL17N1]|uniref:lysine N(6)-hydroxylase/L-ornithine N(5)-oxygenase family protein n=1 Tax=Paraburkholderia sp. BL17N1 TaxID=1938798 RepID=UPI000EB12717|nr:SidA/IucD/PvdA family monooxygenase [Paraburkholderia sp. BL17N1]RKR43238.1 lysine/ornithine N-monooxygenase [Paraburkholderia sp. BL17N1]